MQTIDNSLYQVSVDENGACMKHLVSDADSFDYLAAQTTESVAVAFPVIDQEDSWSSDLPWTVVDKGDTRVSLMMIDTPESYKVFPYHFEVMTTYALEGNQLEIAFYLKNSSNKEMPFGLGFVWPTAWQIESGVNKISLKKDEHEVEIASTDFKLSAEEGKIAALTDKLNIGAKEDYRLVLNLTLK